MERTDGTTDLPTILIADDEPGLRMLVSATLGTDDYTIVEAVDGEQAWTLLLQHRPRLAILDVQMPGLTGVAVARAIRAEPTLMDTRVVMLTAQARAADVEAGLAAGADVYLTKPFSPLDLLTTVERMLAA